MIRVVAGILERDGCILACRRREGADHAGRWELPGGKIEDGETPEAALRRELREELGIDASVGTIVERVRHRYPGRAPLELTFFRISGFSGEICNRAFAEVRWVPPGRLPELDFLEADRGLVARLTRPTPPPSNAFGPSSNR